MPILKPNIVKIHLNPRGNLLSVVRGSEPMTSEEDDGRNAKSCCRNPLEFKLNLLNREPVNKKRRKSSKSQEINKIERRKTLQLMDYLICRC